MQSTTHAARRRGYLSRHESQRLARVAAFSRRTPEGLSGEVPVTLGLDQLKLIDWLVRRDRTPVSTALLAVAGIGAGDPIRVAVLAQLTEAARRAQSDGQITARRGEQIAWHVRRALDSTDVGIAA